MNRVSRLIVTCYVFAAVGLPASFAQEDSLTRGKSATALVDARDHGSGTAFCLSRDGVFVTNAHVVDGIGLGGVVTLVMNSGDSAEFRVPATVVSMDSGADLALVKTDQSIADTPALPLGDVSRLRETDQVTVFGFPFGQMLSLADDNPAVSVNVGKVSSLRKKDGVLNSIQMDATVNPGNSGGPVIDDSGRVIGIVASGIPGAGINFAIPVSQLKEFVKKPGIWLKPPAIRWHDRHKSVEFGITVYEMSKDARPDSVEVEFLSENGTQTLKATRSGNAFSLRGAPVAAPKEPHQVEVRTRQRGRPKFYHTSLEDVDVKVGDKTLRLSEVTFYSPHLDGGTVLTVRGERLTNVGVLSPLETLKTQEGPVMSLDKVARHIIRSKDPDTGTVIYRIRAKRNGEEVAQSSGYFHLTELPLFATGFGPPPLHQFSESAPDELTFILPVWGIAEIRLNDFGFYLVHRTDRPPAYTDLKPGYIFVNERPWITRWITFGGVRGFKACSLMCPVEFGDCEWEYEVLRYVDGRNGRTLPGKRGVITLSRSVFSTVLRINDTPGNCGVYHIRLRKKND